MVLFFSIFTEEKLNIDIYREKIKGQSKRNNIVQLFSNFLGY